MPQTKQAVKLSKRQFYPVPVTLEPKQKLRIIKASKQDVHMAVNEAEFVARILEHKQVTPEIANTIRALTAVACLFIAKALDTHEAEPQMVRDFWPYARLIKSVAMRELFESLMVDIKRDAPRLFKSMVSSKGAKA